LFQELTHNELAAEDCHKRVATLRYNAGAVSPRADQGGALRKKSLEELAKEQELRDNAPHEFLCPITLEIMKSPVIAPDGFTYHFLSFLIFFFCSFFPFTFLTPTQRSHTFSIDHN
jgi:U-box domain